MKPHSLHCPVLFAFRATFVLCFAAVLALAALGCVASHHPAVPGELGRAASSDAMLAVARDPGPVVLEKVVAADWLVIRSGLINLDHPKAQAAGLEDGDEPIEIYFFVLRHPRFGTFIVDSGVESAYRDEAGSPRISWLMKTAMRTDTLEVRVTTAEWLAQQSEALAGVFITHIHLDHVMGLPDVPAETPIYVGPGEPGARQFLNAFTAGSIDGQFEGKGPLREWPFSEDADGRFDGVLDVFGDGSVWALHVPGHTPGSTAFLVRTPDGPHLLIGDATHTRFGWENGVEPGSFSHDPPRSAESLAKLKQLAAEIEGVRVHPGHQSLPSGSAIQAVAR